MRESRKTALCLLALMLALLAACAQELDMRGEEADPGQGLYTTVVHYTGEDDSTERYLEIAQRSQALFQLLEEKAGAFIMNAYNFQDIDGKGTPLYTMNGMDYPAEIDPAGRKIQVSRNYFQHCPIQTADGSALEEQFVYDDLTLTLLVPEQYRELEGDIEEAYRQAFYFEKVQAENDFNEMAGREARLELPAEELKIHIIYVEDGQRYAVFRPDCAVDTGGWIVDPVVELYTGNIHCSYAHSAMTQWVYLPYEGDAQEAYQAISPYVEQCGAGDSIRQVEPAYAPEAQQ